MNAKEIKQAALIDDKDGNESRTSDSKQYVEGMEQTIGGVNKYNLSESGMMQQARKPLVESYLHKSSKTADLPPIDMKIHLQKADRVDSNSHNMDVPSPRNQDSQLDNDSNDPLFNYPMLSHQPVIRERRNAAGTPMKTASKRRDEHSSSGKCDLNALNNKLYGFCKKTDNILYTLGD